MIDTSKLLTIAENEQRVFEAGKKAEQGDFWDRFQQNGSRGAYEYAFQRVWDGLNFNPKYSMNITNANHMFYNVARYSPVLDLIALEEKGIALDFSNCTSMEAAFHTNYLVTRIATLDMRKCTSLYCAFYNSASLKQIKKIILKDDGTNTFSSTFTGCNSLAELRIEGVIGNNITLSACPLSVESAKSVIEHLKNYAGTTNESKYTVKLKSTVWDNLEASGKSPDGNTWLEYVANKGWLT